MQETRNSIADIWGQRTPYVDNWPTRVDERILEEPQKWVQSACLLCSNGCGIDIGVKDGRSVGVRGRAVDAVNHGRLGPKGLHGWVANHSGDRLTRPLIRRNGQLEAASWDEAMDAIVQRSQEIVLLLKASHPPSAATTLLVALGGYKTIWHDALTIIIGVLLLAIFGEVLRFLRLGKGRSQST